MSEIAPSLLVVGNVLRGLGSCRGTSASKKKTPHRATLLRKDVGALGSPRRIAFAENGVWQRVKVELTPFHVYA